MAIRVQREDFDVGAEIDALTVGNARIGGVTSFVGLVRDMAGDGRIDGGGAASGTGSAMTLEHYPGMTEKCWRRSTPRRNRAGRWKRA